MLTLAHHWSRRQKWLIVSSVVLALISVGALIYGYERYYRGPGEEVFYGTWQDTLPAMDSITYYRFKPDSTVDLIMDGMGSIDVVTVGKWYAGGPNLYVRFPPPPDETTVMRPYVWHIVDISPEKIVLRETQHGALRVLVRVHDPLPTASNPYEDCQWLSR